MIYVGKLSSGAAAPGTPDWAFPSLVLPMGNKRIYVSTSIGSDAYDGLLPAPDGMGGGPKKTLGGPPNGGTAGAFAVYAGGDWVLLKRGDTWTGADIDNSTHTPGQVWGNFYGVSAVAPLVVSTYGPDSDPAPVVQDSQFNAVSYNFIEGIDFQYVGTYPGVNGAIIVSGDVNKTTITIENCHMHDYTAAFPSGGTGIIITPGDGFSLTDLVIRGCVIYDNYGTPEAAGGILCGHTSGILIEWCVLDQNGWKPGVSLSNNFNHNVYLSESNLSAATFQNNITARASSHGIMMRTGGLGQCNLFLKNPIALLAGGGLSFGNPGTMRWNVILNGADTESNDGEMGDPQPRGWAINSANAQGMAIYDNIAAHNVDGTNGWASDITNACRNFSYTDNIFYKWTSPAQYHFIFEPDSSNTANVLVARNAFVGPNGGFVQMFHPFQAGLVFDGNDYYSAAGIGGDPSKVFLEDSLGAGNFYDASTWPAASGESNAVFTNPTSTWPDPERMIETYMTMIGGTPTLDAFLDAAKAMWRQNWSPAYSSIAVINYIRSGFGRSRVGPGVGAA